MAENEINNKNNDENQAYPSDCDNLEFKIQKIEFFPDDIEKMKNMDIDEQIAYKGKLKAEQRYTVIFEDEDN